MDIDEDDLPGRVYYRGPGIAVTSDYFILHEPGSAQGRLRLADMRSLTVGHRATKRRRNLLLGAASLLIVVVGGLLAYQSGEKLVVAGLVGFFGSLLIHCVTSLVQTRNAPQWTLFCGIWDGQLRLYESDDAREFARVVQAVKTAMRERR
ncbi:hypothetical protein BJY16_005620 [Actinoplanes octamycinicus]|uniref:Uncharacterized protein n=1 Tax=Actinoplanes octamycinicus TaxID=135948 RepID=A0A7W7H1A1_9ACTN|nr:DUF6232 family protein [Actinoplanes octamycinicus]MBB4742161.1 hypothetical protein [Actinoplanes octamycinicus]GIE59993.1 hypothetical protein Aoc01nite_53950 [Actinoplanes octamycinicus]